MSLSKHVFSIYYPVVKREWFGAGGIHILIFPHIPWYSLLALFSGDPLGATNWVSQPSDSVSLYNLIHPLITVCLPSLYHYRWWKVFHFVYLPRFQEQPWNLDVVPAISSEPYGKINSKILKSTHIFQDNDIRCAFTYSFQCAIRFSEWLWLAIPSISDEHDESIWTVLVQA